MYDYKKIPAFKGSNIVYLYCVSKYPTALSEINMPDFDKSFFKDLAIIRLEYQHVSMLPLGRNFYRKTLF